MGENSEGAGPEIAASTGAPIMIEHQRLATSGARTAYPFALDGVVRLAVPQLAIDVAGGAAHMNGGDSDSDMLFYRWSEGRFVADGSLPTPGGEDVTSFTIDGRTMLATASVRTGSGPYEYNAHATIYRREGDGWAVLQTIPTFAAKQWYHFSFDGRHFLALAQGVTVPTAAPRHPRESRLFEWRDGRFEEFQMLDGKWGYNFAYFEHAGHRFLAYADHTSPSLIYRWDGAGFVPFQTLGALSGRAFKFFEQDNAAWLAYAAIDEGSTLFRWEDGRFVAHQSLGGPGGREFELIRTPDALHLVRMCFIEGSPAAPKTDLVSQLYRWEDGGFVERARFATFGGTDASAFTANDTLYLAVSNSLTPDIRFRQDTIIYRLAL